MKKVVLAFSLLLISAMTFGQQKIGYVNSEELILSMPEAKKADADINAYAKTYQDQLAKMQKDLETKYKAYEEGMKTKTLTEAMQGVKEKELQDLQANLQSTQQVAEEKVATKRQELLKPITEKADQAIQSVAKEKGYSYIFDVSAGGIIYALPSDDILKDVQNKLGIKPTTTTTNSTVAPKK
ncbi:MAG TPA: OmpH family outer membrane protein [Chitinophagaceae bacterium]|mgnify:FL=1|nr:OmpH family outer membrane protein [Chitinophagaceae bacterium]